MTAYPPRSPLIYEGELLVQNLRRIRDYFLNQTFDLRLEGAQRRKRTLTLGFLLIVFVIAIFTHPLSDWLNALRNIFIWLLNPGARQNYPGNPINDLVILAVGSVSNLLRYFAILVFPYWAALHAASLFLADIFEKPVVLAREFISQVALGGAGEIVSIEDGVFTDRENSRIYAIGGPGYVVVDRNSAALFEKHDGRPHVIGPTINGPVRLDGFERFRSAIDLRDQHIDLREQEDREIASRSQDGIPISAIDVSMRFSVWRGTEKQRTLREPNPFKDDQVIEDLVYNQEILVSKEPKPKDTPVDIPAPIGPPVTALIRSEFSKFISEHRLSEFLASYGLMEVEAARAQARSILEKTQQVLPPGEPAPELHPPEKVPDFTPRSDISAQFNEGFVVEANRRGVQLDWIGVGTWKTPVGIVPEHHLEAWKLSLENAARGSDQALEAVARDATLYKMIQIIQNVPLARHQENLSKPGMGHREAVKRLLVSYLEQMSEARELIAARENDALRIMLPRLDEAIDYVNELLGWKAAHYPGRVVADDGAPVP
ncbi:MAG: hypothetical protein ACM3QS_06390 [Bacteroidota bacterium]